MKKMKKDERLTYIRQRAYELAREGAGINWHSIEMQLRGEGYGEARRILDNQYIREELDEICKIAKSADEETNRENFREWINSFIDTNIEEIKKEEPTVNIYTRENMFSISGPKKEYEIRKKFNGRKIIGDYIFEENDGRSYRIKDYYSSDKDYDEFDIEDIIELTKGLAE